MDNKDMIFKFIEENTLGMVELQKLLTQIPALAPENGGIGEKNKAEALIKWLFHNGFDNVRCINVTDERVPSAERPNIIASVSGIDTSRSLWIMTHLDVVPPGDEKLWETDPFQAVEKNGRLYGRGVEDNQQSMVASIFSLLAFIKNGITPALNVNLLFVADEEVGSNFGVKYLLKNYSLFQKNDLILVPDGGTPVGEMIEIAEKSPLWIKFTTKGIQCHASRPDKGRNAFLAGSYLAVELSKLGNIFNSLNDLFDPPFSTFTPTKKESNVPNINTIPGEDIFYMDCRLLPSLKHDTVIEKIKSIIRIIEEQHKVEISFEIIQKLESLPTDKNSEIVLKLKSALKQVYDVDAKPIGIGGGTVAALFRNEGYSCAVWSKIHETAHMPNEYCVIENMAGDSKVMAGLMMQ